MSQPLISPELVVLDAPFGPTKLEVIDELAKGKKMEKILRG